MGVDETNSTYYTKGSEEVATETALTLRKLEKRHELTRNSKRLVIALVGLPARGKSFVSRKLETFLNWSGHKCKIFNVGKYRRQAYALISKETNKDRGQAGSCDANFFDAKNKEASALRERVAAVALEHMLKWLDGEDEGDDQVYSSSSQGFLGHNRHPDDRVAIFDATNSTRARRQWILEQCTSPELRAGKPTGVVFVESICDDEELLHQNYSFKIKNSPDFKGMSLEAAMADLKSRVQKYEERYEPVDDENQSYIKIFNLSSKVLVNHIYGRMAKIIVPALMAWNVGTRPIFLCRAGKTSIDELGASSSSSESPPSTDIEDNSEPSNQIELSGHKTKRKLMKQALLGGAGLEFRDALADFVEGEARAFMRRREEIAYQPDLNTGTSQTGLSTYRSEVTADGEELPFPLSILTSTMPRASETVMFDKFYLPSEAISNLNPLDKGDFAGMELEDVATADPKWYSKLEKNPYLTRFPGGESYRDLTNRLQSVIIEMEQQVAPVLIVSHVSVLQALIAYFRNSPVESCMSIEVPMHTVMKFTPSRGGGWMESQHPLENQQKGLVPVISDAELSIMNGSATSDQSNKSTPIWGDHAPSLVSP